MIIKIAKCSDNISIGNEYGWYSLTLWCELIYLPCSGNTDNKDLGYPFSLLRLTSTNSSKFNSNIISLVKVDLDQIPQIELFPSSLYIPVVFCKVPCSCLASGYLISPCLCGLLGLNPSPLLFHRALDLGMVLHTPISSVLNGWCDHTLTFFSPPHADNLILAFRPRTCI